MESKLFDPILDNYDTITFNSTVLPKYFLEQTNLDLLDKLKGKDWRFDFPIGEENNEKFEITTILSMCLDIFQRGNVTFLLNDLEKLIKNYFNSDETELLPIYVSKASINNNLKFDSDREKKFFDEFLQKYFQGLAKRFVTTQVSLINLTNENRPLPGERVDFVITLPNKKIVVELDGDEHKDHESRDNSRDTSLKLAGFKVIRIKNKEVDDGQGPNIDLLYNELSNFQKNIENSFSKSDYYKGIKLAHLLQVSILTLYLNNVLSVNKKVRLSVDLDSINLSKKDSLFVLNETINELKLLVSKYCKFFNISNELNLELVDINDNPDHLISFEKVINEKGITSVIQEVELPINDINFKNYPKKDLELSDKLNKEILEYFLKQIFGFDFFKPGQLESIRRILLKKDTITLLPTGAGKSVIFQLSKFFLTGIVIIVAPTKALMQDQVENLKKRGISRSIAINSDLEKNTIPKILNNFSNYNYYFVYVTPERFIIDSFKVAINRLNQNDHKISLRVIDEAHCISEWGHDFRPAYLSVADNSSEYCKSSKNNVPPLIALTGTASETVLSDMSNILNIKDPNGIIDAESFDRAELRFNIIKVSNKTEKLNKIKELLNENLPEKFEISEKDFKKSNGLNTFCGIIFCPVTGVLKKGNINRNKNGVMYYCEELEKSDISCKPYHSNTKELKVQEKEKNAREFKENKVPLLIATKGYGMGIDKPNIRYVIHSSTPQSVEQFYQEAGRGGRDGKTAQSYIVYSNQNLEKIKEVLDPTLDYDSFYKKYNSFDQNTKFNNDILVSFYFHTGSFLGKEEDFKTIKKICEEIKKFDINENLNFSFEKLVLPTKSNAFESDEDNNSLRNIYHKAIIRLISIGAIKDYSLNFLNNEFTINLSSLTTKEKIKDKYLNLIRKYNPQLVKNEEKKILNIIEKLNLFDFILEVSQYWLDFYYDSFEKTRRRAIATMFEFIEEAQSCKTENETDLKLRTNILNFLKRTYSDKLNNITKSEVYKFSDLNNLFEQKSISLIDFDESLKPQILRFLEDSPDNPGLSFSLIVASIRTQDKLNKNFEEKVISNILKTTKISIEKYKIEEIELVNTLLFIFKQIEAKNKTSAKKIIEEIFQKSILIEKLVKNYGDKKDLAYKIAKKNLILSYTQEIKKVLKVNN